MGKRNRERIERIRAGTEEPFPHSRSRREIQDLVLEAVNKTWLGQIAKLINSRGY